MHEELDITRDHYQAAISDRAALLTRITSSLDATDAPVTAQRMGGFDQFHIGGLASTVELAKRTGIPGDAHVLDAGSGLGGPSRYLAETFGCQVTGVDLAPDYVAIAQLLADKAGVADKARYVAGSITYGPQLARHQAAVPQRADAHGTVHMLFHQSHHAIGQLQVDVDQRIRAQELVDHGLQVLLAEAQGRGDHEIALGLSVVAGDVLVGVPQVIDDSAAGFEMALAALGQCDVPGGAGEQAHAQRLFQQSHLAADIGHWLSQRPTGGRKAAAAGHGHEGRDGVQAIHGGACLSNIQEGDSRTIWIIKSDAVKNNPFHAIAAFPSTSWSPS
jgi:SAM-dependent methyltransferase